MAIVGKTMFPLHNSIRNITGMKARFDQLQVQLATGKKAANLAEMGTDRFFNLSMRSQLGRIESFGSAIGNVNLRLDVLGSTFARLDVIESDQRSLITPGGYGSSGINLSTAPQMSRARLDEVLNLLNTSIDGRYLLGGSTTDRMPVAELPTVLDGGSGKAGFRTVLEERTLADRGDGLGRLAITAPAADTVRLAEDGTHPFGFKIAAVRSTAAGMATVGPTGAPPGHSVQFAGVPVAGQSIEISLAMPDGTEELVRLSATHEAGGQGTFKVNEGGQATLSALDAAVGGDLNINGEVFTVDPNASAATIADQVNASPSLDVTASVGADGELILTGDTATTDVVIGGDFPMLNGTHTANAHRAANFAAALETTLTEIGRTTLAAASAFAAADNFFNGRGEPVLRVDGDPSFAEASALRVASATDTVFWYQGGTQAIRADDMGRLNTAVAGALTTLSEDAPLAVDYGFRLAGVTSTLSNATVTPPAGLPDTDNGPTESLSVAFTGLPADGETISIQLRLPNGATRDVSLRAVDGVAGPGEFAIGTDADATAANFRAALDVGLGAAAQQAAGSARSSVSAQVDDGVRVSYGVQANENGTLELVRALAAMSTTSYANDDGTAPQRFDAMAARNLGRLNEGHNNEPGSLEVIAVELGLVQATMGSIGERHLAQKAQLEDMLGDLEGVPEEEVAMEILALRTRLEASYQTTAMLAQMSLVNYL